MRLHTICFVLILILIAQTKSYAEDLTEVKLPRLLQSNIMPPGGDLSTGLFGGTMPTTVSFTLLPSAGNLQDKISLSLIYQTNEATSNIGKGWSFTPGIITRINKYGVNNPNNPYLLALNGESQELVSIGNGEYRTKMETFLKISLSGSVWTVVDRKGTEYRFEISVAGTSYLTKVTEPHGLYMTLSYDQPNSQEIYLQQISYPFGPGISPYNTIAFISENRSDVLTSYATGALSVIKRRLNEVHIKAQNVIQKKYVLAYTTNGPSTSSILQSVTEVGKNGSALPPTTFTYQQPLSSDYFTTTKTLMAANNRYTFNGKEQRDSLQLAVGVNATLVDLNGDNLPDLLGSQYASTSHLAPTNWVANLNKGNNTFDSTNKIWLKSSNSLTSIPCGGVGWSHVEHISLSRNAALADMNQDGMPDLVYSKPVACEQGTMALYEIYVRYNTGSEFSSTEVKLLDRAYANQKVSHGFTTYYQRDMLGSTATLQDMNGDGLPDLVFNRMNGTNPAGGSTVGYYMDWMVRLNTGNGFSTESKIWASGNNLYYVATIDSFNKQLKPVTVSSGSFLEDMNGDGLPDLVYNDLARFIVGQGDSLNFKVRLNTGTGFSEEVLTYLADSGGYSYTPAPANIRVFVSTGFSQNGTLMDINNDGLPDLVYNDYVTTSGIVANNWLVRFNLGQSFGAPVKYFDSMKHQYADSFVGFYNVVVGNSYFIDMNKDGVKDFVYFQYKDFNNFVTFNLNVATHMDTIATNLLTKESTPQGGVTTRTYVSSGEFDPVGIAPVSLPFTIPVVRTESKDPIRGSVAGTYTNTYEGGLYDIKSREFRGFQHVQTTDPLGHKFDTYFLQDPAHLGKISSQQDLNRKTVFTYLADSSAPFHTPVSQIDETIDGKTKRKNFEYDSFGNITRLIEYGDMSVTGDERTTLTDYAINSAKWMLDYPSRIRLFANATGLGAASSETQIFYDGHPSITDAPTWGDKTLLRQFLSVGGQFIDNKTSYDSYGNQVSTRDPLGNETKFEYDTTFRVFPTKEINPKNHTILSTYYQPVDTKGLFGQLKSQTDANGNTTTYEYDDFGRKSKVIGPLDVNSLYGSESYTYAINKSADNYVIKRTTEQNGTSNVLMQVDFQDGFGRDIASFKEARNASQTRVISKSYNARGELEKVSLPYFIDKSIDTVYAPPPTNTPLPTANYSTQTQYDAIGRVTRILKSDGGVITNAYNGYATVTTDENGHVKTLINDAYDRLSMVKEKNGAEEYTTSYNYDVLNNLTRIVDHKGNVTTNEYNALGWLLSSTDPDLGKRTYQYDNNGNVTRLYNPQLIAMTYDALNRMTTKSYPYKGVTMFYGYDELGEGNTTGRRTSMFDPSGVTRWGYDHAGQIVKEVRHSNTGMSYFFQKTYDAMGRITSITYPNSKVVKYNYNTAGLTEGIEGYISSIDYNAAEQPVTIKFANGLTKSSTYYPENYRLKSMVVPGLQNLAYEYDFVGNITKITDNIHSFQRPYTYDHLNRLLTGDGNTYSYDAIGNIINANGNTYQYNAGLAHAVSSDGINNYVYDSAGNMIFGPGRSIIYDPENKPVNIAYNSSANPYAKPINTNFYYDGDGNRVRKVSGNIYYKTTEYVDGLYEYDLYPYSAERLNISLNGQNVAMEENGQVRLYLNDHLGGTNVVTDVIGSQVEYTDYKPFGEIKMDIGSVKTKKKFTGKEYDDSTGLYDYSARMYDPKLGRFISADTINPDLTDPQKLNRYSYCLNNPLKYVDPSGHVPVLAVWAVTYLNAVLSSPDFQQDVNMFMLDASRGDIGGAALDVVGAAMPGVSAGAVKGVGKLAENIAATFKNSQYKTKILETSQKAYRVFGGKSTLEGASDGIFLAGREYKTSTNAKKFLALPKGNTTDKISEVTIPKGTEIQYGKIERLGVQPGGGTQLYIRDKSKLIFDKPKDLK